MEAIQSEAQRSRRLHKLTEVSRALTYAVSLDDVLHLAVDQAAELLDAPVALLMLVNDDGVLSVRASHGIDPRLTKRFAEPLTETLPQRLRALLGGGTLDFLGVPLVVKGEVTGIVAVGRPPEARDEGEDEWLLSALADQAAVALEHTRLDETVALRERLISLTTRRLESERAAREVAEAAVRSRASILATVSHDLRNPLGTITLSAALLENPALGEAARARALAVIRRSAERMNRLVADLLNAAVVEEGHLAVTVRPVAVGPLLAEGLEQLEPLAARKAIRLVATVAAEGLRALCDRDRVLQILSNLVGNAIKFTPDGGTISLGVVTLGPELLFAVSDSGPGIPESQLDLVFDRLWQGQRGGHAGAGLGLSIVRELVAAQGGRVWVHSAAGAGASFFFTLPVATGVPEPREARRVLPPPDAVVRH
jgi:sigma-B regulation protein RsbU (phosphoserine phosphatase)